MLGGGREAEAGKWVGIDLPRALRSFRIACVLRLPVRAPLSRPQPSILLHITSYTLSQAPQEL